jgi:caffeoyl-CoA O-methyltransferase
LDAKYGTSLSEVNMDGVSQTHIQLTGELAVYLRHISLREPAALKRLREETAQLPQGSMQITPEQGQFMRLLVKTMNAKRTLEVGVFTGYSSSSVALGLPAGGKVVACDLSAEWTSIARRYWRELGVESRIELHLGPALLTLDRLISDGQSGTFDFVFIDADKENYQCYFERGLLLVRHGGIIAIDNVFWHGRVVDSSFSDSETLAIRQFNEKLAGDERVLVSTIPIGDGLTLALKL